MTPARAFEMVVLAWASHVGRQRPSGTSVQWYLNRGREIPDYELPGRVILRQSAEVREQLSRLTANDTWHNADETQLNLSELSGDETSRLFERIANRR